MRAGLRAALPVFVVFAVVRAAPAQQVVDSAYAPRVAVAAWAAGTGPVVAIDTGHNNGAAFGGALRPLRHLLASDGYQVGPFRGPIAATALRDVDVLVIVDALADRNVGDWSLPTPSAFDSAARATLVAWVRSGGALLLVADHMPFAGAASALVAALGVETLNGFAIDTIAWDPIMFRASDGSLGSHPITRGRLPAESVDSVFTYWGHAFRSAGADAAPLMIFRPGIVSLQPEQAWRFAPGTPTVAIGGWAAGMALRVGRGRVVVLGDSGMLSAHLVGPRRRPVGLNAPEGRQNAQFIVNAMHWLAGLLDPPTERP